MGSCPAARMSGTARCQYQAMPPAPGTRTNDAIWVLLRCCRIICSTCLGQPQQKITSACDALSELEAMRAKLCSPKINSVLLVVGCFEVGRDEVSFQKSGSKVCDRVWSSLSCVRRLGRPKRHHLRRRMRICLFLDEVLRGPLQRPFLRMRQSISYRTGSTPLLASIINSISGHISVAA